MSDETNYCPCCGQSTEDLEITEWDQEEYERRIKLAVDKKSYLEGMKKVSDEEWRKHLLDKSKGIG